MLSSWILPELQFLQVGKVLPLRPYQCRAERNNYILRFITPLPIAHNSTGLVCSSTTSLVHVQLGIIMTPGLFCRTAAWPVVSHLYSCAADYVKLYVQFCICSNLTAEKLYFLGYSATLSGPFSIAFLPTCSFCSMNFIKSTF